LKNSCNPGLIRDRVGASECDDDANEAYHSQTNANHRGRNGKNVDTNILLEAVVLILLALRLFLHGT